MIKFIHKLIRRAHERRQERILKKQWRCKHKWFIFAGNATCIKCSKEETAEFVMRVYKDDEKVIV